VAAQGGALTGAEMLGFRNLATGGDAQFARAGESLLSYRLAVAGDTIALARTTFRVTRTTPVAGVETVRLDGVATTRAGAAVPVALVYTFKPDSFLVRVQGSATGFSGPAFLLVDLPSTLRNTERDSVDHFNHLAYAYKPQSGSAKGAPFARLDPGERKLVEGPLTWVVAKSKYFLVGVLAPAGAKFDQLELTGGVRATRLATRANATLVQALNNGGFTFEVYAGPQEWRRMVALGRDFENANPYGGWLQGIVQPFATLAIRVMLWMHDALKLSYGWVLVALGVLVRVILWPLQQGAMRSQLKMQRIQPEMQAIQQRYKNDPQKLQTEMMRLYKEHNMSPFSALGGCLPMLLPMPIFFALFFVFQNTIEFRGVPWLYLSDISLKDPFYVMPVLVALTQFAVSYIAMKSAPPNPQTKMMTYAMPAMFLFFFINVASGLNLYYLVQNLVSIPQQWLLSRERAKAGVQPIIQGTPTPSPARRKA
jgi:YidC/Oxa1 family membrane protein insertase